MKKLLARIDGVISDAYRVRRIHARLVDLQNQYEAATDHAAQLALAQRIAKLTGAQAVRVHASRLARFTTGLSAHRLHIAAAGWHLRVAALSIRSATSSH